MDILSLHSFLFIAHIIVGSCALVLFWLPIATRKGALNHRRFGRWYSLIMYSVAATGALMATLVLIDPVAVKGEWIKEGTDIAVFEQRARVMWVWLLYLSLLSSTGTRHGNAVLNPKAHQTLLRKWHYQAPLIVLGLGGIALFALGWQFSHTLHMIFGVLGVSVSLTSLRYCYRNTVTASERITEHLGAMVGTGIGAYTAFLSFGGRTLFADLGQWQLVFWIAPGVIGAIAIHIYCKQSPLTQTATSTSQPVHTTR